MSLLRDKKYRILTPEYFFRENPNGIYKMRTYANTDKIK
jgi:hypothetical protein